MWKKATALVLCLAFCALCLASCGKSEEKLFLPMPNIATSCDPQIAGDDGLSSIANNAYEGLVREDRDGRILPGVAERWSVSGGGRLYTFHLKSGQKYHLTDGMGDILGKNYKKTFDTEVTADDFVFGMQRAVAKNTQAPYASKLNVIQNAQAIHSGAMSASALGVQAQGRYTLRIVLEHPDINFLHLLTSAPCMPCKRAFFRATNGQYGLSGDLALCNGPYYLSNINTIAGTVLLKKNPDYQGSYKPLSDQLKFILAQDLGGTGSSGENQTAPQTSDDTASPIDIINSLQTDQGLSAGLVAKDETDTLPRKYGKTDYENEVKALCLNQKSKFSSNSGLRMAIAYSTDVRQVSSAISSPADGIIPDCCVTSGQYKYRRQAGRSVLGRPNMAKAVKAFQSGAASLGISSKADSDDSSSSSSSSTEDSTVPTRVHLICLNDDKSDVQSLLQNWQKVFGTGLSVVIKTYKTQDELDQAIEDGKYDICYTAITADDSAAADFLGQFCSDSGQKNFIHLADPAFDQAVSTARAGQNDAAIAQACRSAEHYLISHGYILPIRKQSNTLVTLKSARDIFVSQSGNVYSSFEVPEEDAN